MKQVILGDIHGRTIWKKILEVEKDADRVIFIGDYLDTHDDVSGLEQAKNLRDIFDYKQSTNQQVIMLIGNHDHHYFPEVGYTGTSGYQSNMKVTFEDLLNKNRDLLQMCFEDEHGTVYSHAGVSQEWLDIVKEMVLDQAGVSTDDLAAAINQLFIFKPTVFCYNQRDYSNYGNHPCQSPIWIRPQALYNCQIDKLQVVGHTGVNKINHPAKSERRGFYLIDNLEHGEYLVRIDDKFTIKQQLGYRQKRKPIKPENDDFY